MQKISHTTLSGNDFFGFSFRCAKEQREIVVVVIFHICRFRNKSFLSHCQEGSGAGCPPELCSERLPVRQPGALPLSAASYLSSAPDPSRRTG